MDIKNKIEPDHIKEARLDPFIAFPKFNFKLKKYKIIIEEISKEIGKNNGILEENIIDIYINNCIFGYLKESILLNIFKKTKKIIERKNILKNIKEEIIKQIDKELSNHRIIGLKNGG